MAQVALLTQHGKAVAFAPLAEQLGHEIVLTTAYDTDQLGTFTGERVRQGSALDAALTKARLAAELTGLPYGLGSEGSFGPDPYVGLSPWGVELVCWWDVQRQHAVHATAQGAQPSYQQQTFTDEAAAVAWAERLDFPTQGVIVGRPGDPWFDKSLLTLDTLRARVREALAHGPVWLETDMRAHRNPSRMAMIEAAARALATRLQTPCPRCATAGFGPVRLVPGARCEACARPTPAARAQVLRCDACGHEAEAPLRTRVPASRCEACNP